MYSKSRLWFVMRAIKSVKVEKCWNNCAKLPPFMVFKRSLHPYVTKNKSHSQWCYLWHYSWKMFSPICGWNFHVVFIDSSTKWIIIICMNNLREMKKWASNKKRLFYYIFFSILPVIFFRKKKKQLYTYRNSSYDFIRGDD